jgi:AcrR family transcriptional regulator
MRKKTTVRRPNMSATGQKTKTVRKTAEKAEDRRAARTRRLIKEALADLMHAQRYENITVQDIIDRADIGRSTFYAHYQDKDELVTQFFEEMMESITREAKPGADAGNVALPIADLFRHLKDQASTNAVWLGTRGREFLFTVGQKYWRRRLERELKARIPVNRTPAVPTTLVAQMMIGAATSLLHWWMNNKMPYSPEEMEAMFNRLMMPGIRIVCGLDRES